MGNQLTIKGAGLSQAAVLALISANAAALSHKTQHQDGGSDEVDASLLTGRINYVERAVAASYDFTVGNFTQDGSAYALDLSSILPANAKHVHLKLLLIHTAVAGQFMKIWKNGLSNVATTPALYPQVNGASVTREFIVPVDADRKVQYLVSGTAMSTINLFVLGYFI